MNTTINLMVSLWDHVGPGIILAALLPVLLIAFGYVLFTSVRRLREVRAN